MPLLPLRGDQGEEEQCLKGEDTGKGKGREEERTSFLFPSPLIIVECVVESARRCNGREKKNKNQKGKKLGENKREELTFSLSYPLSV